MIATCQVCENDPFQVPWDEHGAALMQAHFHDEHPKQCEHFTMDDAKADEE